MILGVVIEVLDLRFWEFQIFLFNTIRSGSDNVWYRLFFWFIGAISAQSISPSPVVFDLVPEEKFFARWPWNSNLPCGWNGESKFPWETTAMANCLSVIVWKINSVQPNQCKPILIKSGFPLFFSIIIFYNLIEKKMTLSVPTQSRDCEIRIQFHQLNGDENEEHISLFSFWMSGWAETIKDVFLIASSQWRRWIFPIQVKLAGKLLDSPIGHTPQGQT